MKTALIVVLGVLLGWAGYRQLADAPHARPAPAPAETGTSGAATPARDDAPAAATTDTATRSATDAHAAEPTGAPAAAVPPPPRADGDNVGDSSPLLLPVQGIGREQLHDTFTDARSEGRVHDAIDILAPAGTPVLAVADGTVEKLFDSKRGGLAIYQFEPSGKYCYYYAHLQRYADRLTEQQSIRRGQVIGYVGSTGNASAEAPHLHFEIHVLGPERHWWQGEALNPYPILRGEATLP